MRDTPPLDGVEKQIKGYKSPIPFLEDALVHKCSVFLFLLKQCQEQKYRCLPATFL